MHIILAPCNLGLRPLRPGHIPGTWRAPQVLMAHGLAQRLEAETVTSLPRPDYSPNAQTGTRLYNGHAIRDFSLRLAADVSRVHSLKGLPLIVGGDCSILLGALLGSQSSTPLALVHLDGHSDFRHPGNYDPQATLGAVAGMDLALATGRGEALLTEWPGVAGPLVADRDVIQLGERESRDADFAWPDIAQTAITGIDVFTAQGMGRDHIASEIRRVIHGKRFWLHVDVDVLDQTVMPAVDSPGSPGIEKGWLEAICAPLLKHPLCCGMTLTVYDPDSDPEEQCAERIVDMLEQMFGRRQSTSKT